MNRIYLLLFAVCFLSSCENDFQLEAPWKDIPIVYGILSAQDTAHYIRIEKAFLEPGGDAEAIAQLPDSIYYDRLEVALERVSTGRRYNLQRVDGNQDGYPRQDGPFAQSPNFLYKIKAEDIQLQGEEQIRLLINRGENHPMVTAETTIMEALEPRQNNPVSPVNMSYDRLVNFVWTPGPSARLFDVRLLIHYRESLPNNSNSFTPKTLEWVLNDALVRENDEERAEWGVMGEDFYRFIGASIDASENRLRIFDAFDLVITAGGEELVEYLRITQVNSGITASQVLPVYTNISEGRGLFTSRSIGRRNGLTLTSVSMDSLRNGIYTGDLNFQ